VAVAELSHHGCVAFAFAVGITDTGIELRAIGDRSSTQLFQYTGACTPYVPPADTELRVLGPPLDPDTFPSAIYYGAR
jgi:hypothetical protein